VRRWDYWGSSVRYVSRSANQLTNSKELSSSSVKKLPAFYGIWRFITVFAKHRNWYVYWDESNPQFLTCFSKIYFIPLMSRSSEWTFTFTFSDQITVCISRLCRAYYKLRPSRPPWFDRLNNICWSVQIMKLLSMQSSSAFRQFLSLGPNILFSTCSQTPSICVLPLV
jgi:hypothetical protein